jgi:hypothetical protein
MAVCRSDECQMLGMLSHANLSKSLEVVTFCKGMRDLVCLCPPRMSQVGGLADSFAALDMGNPSPHELWFHCCERILLTLHLKKGL